MNWIDEVQAGIKRKKQILFSPDDEFLQDLVRLMSEQNRKTMILWALELAGETAQKLSARYPGEKRFEEAVAATRAWARGKVKMPAAKRAILQVHAVAKEIASPEDIALCHAIGQACGVVHTVGHAIGFPVYDLTAIVRRLGIEGCKAAVEARKQQYIERITYWRENHKDYQGDWADFITD